MNGESIQRSVENATDVVRELENILTTYNRNQNANGKINEALNLYRLFNGKQNGAGEVFEALRKQGMHEGTLRDLDKLIFGHHDGSDFSIRNLLFIPPRHITLNDKYQFVDMTRKDNEAINITELDSVINRIAKIISTKD